MAGRGNGAGNGAMLFHRRQVGAMDFKRPLASVIPWTFSQARKQIELQVVMRIDEPWQQEVPRQIAFAGSREWRIEWENAAAVDAQIDAFGAPNADAIRNLVAPSGAKLAGFMPRLAW